ncbi:MAG: hypothetical protein LBJ88_00170 [Campylobacteraceae bacterium]|nr:hypothetical protein [Campylobacteraceae bacterium]
MLAQSIGHGTLVFFNYFSENIKQFNTIELCHHNILCYITPVKIFFKKSNIIKINIRPLIDLRERYLQKEHLAFEPTAYWKKFTIYKGTEDELEIPHVMNGNLRLVNWKLETVKYLDKIKDKEIIENNQLDTMGMYGELNERLYLCYKYGKYIEPNKDLIIGKKIPEDYKTYFLIESQKIEENEWKEMKI